jgi:glutaminyl-tRNA synthetase
VTPEALRNFAEAIGVARKPARTELATFEHFVRDDLNMRVPRVMCVLDPLKVVLTNYPEGEIDWLDASYYPHDVPLEGSRKVPFTRELYIERADFMEDPPKKFFRLAPGREVRLRYGFFITCQEAVKDADGTIVELRCTYDPATRGGDAPDGRKVAATIHWVSATHAVEAEVRLYDKLFAVPNPDAGEAGGADAEDEAENPKAEAQADFTQHLNPQSLVVVRGARVEPSVAKDPVGTRYQFERTGYFVSDPDSREGALVFNRTVTLKDTWAKVKDK